MAGTLGLPFSSKEAWRERLAEKREGNVSLVACARGEVVGHLSLYVYQEPRMSTPGISGWPFVTTGRERGLVRN